MTAMREARRQSGALMALLVILAAAMSGCAGAYIGGDVGPHRARSAALSPVLDRARGG